MLALAQFESELCDCGNHISILDDPEGNVFMPAERVCAVCASIDQYHRLQHARDEAADKNRSDSSPPESPRPADGRKTHLRPVPPDEVAAARAKRTEKPD